eukprot:2144172-Rhodomonas_salina.2
MSMSQYKRAQNAGTSVPKENSRYRKTVPALYQHYDNSTSRTVRALKKQYQHSRHRGTGGVQCPFAAHPVPIPPSLVPPYANVSTATRIIPVYASCTRTQRQETETETATATATATAT